MADSPEEVKEQLEKQNIEVILPDEEGEKPSTKLTPKQTYSDIEIAARDKGWRPKNEFEGSMEEWVDARSFLRQGELMDRIHNQNRKIKKLETVVGGMSKQQKKMFDAGYDKAKRELRGQLREAVRGEHDDQAEAIEEQLDALEQRKKAIDFAAAQEEAQAKAENTEVNTDFVAWVNRNDWFAKHPYMRSYAETVGLDYAKTNPGFTNHEVWDHVAKEVRKKFPERFPDYVLEEDDVVDDKPKRSSKKTPIVEGDTPRTQGRKHTERVELTAEEKQVARLLIKRGDYKNMEEYAADLVKFGAK